MRDYPHNNGDSFLNYLNNKVYENGHDVPINEKDYYLTILLQKISQETPLVFKGGTSLSKGYGVINRFSEDIDFCVPRHLTRGECRAVKYTILNALSEIGLDAENKDKIQSGSKFNRYIAPYNSVSNDETIVKPFIKIETNMKKESFLYHEVDIPTFDGSETFVAQTQDMEETFVEKVFAVCDYYLKKTPYRQSRHLYDIQQMLSVVDSQKIKELVPLVRAERAKDLNLCPSAAPDINVSQMFRNILISDYYEADFKDVTSRIIYDDYKYEQVKDTLLKSVDISTNNKTPISRYVPKTDEHKDLDNDGMEYVPPYVRKDGVKVKGFYRKKKNKRT